MNQILKRSLLTSSLVMGSMIMTGCPGPDKDPPRNGGIDDICTSDNDCKEGLLCVSGFCNQTCDVDNDCQEGYYCTGNNLCRPGTIVSKAICGNGIKESGEACDDGNNTSGDGCDSSCIVEEGYTCNELNDVKSNCSPICGDGLVKGNEECDDGNNDNQDSCVMCKNAICGDGYVNIAGGEECDDGNKVDDDSCNNQCQKNAVVCTGNFTGAECNICLEGWTGTDCTTRVCSGNFTGENCNQCKEHFIGENCDNCENGYYGSDCSSLCPGMPGLVCNGHGSCSDGISGTGTCQCDGNYAGYNCTECKPGYSLDSYCTEYASITAPTIDLAAPFGQTCSTKVVGWTDGSNNPTVVKFTHPSLNSSVYKFNCRTAPAAEIEKAEWQEASAGGNCTLTRNGSHPNGRYTTQVRTVFGATTSTIASVDYYISDGLSGAGCCQSTISNDSWFQKAASALDTSTKFTDTSFNPPYATIKGSLGEKATPVSLHKEFAVNSANTLLLLTRHTSSGYYQRSGVDDLSNNRCSIKAFLGHMDERTYGEYYPCTEEKSPLFKANIQNRLSKTDVIGVHTTCEWKADPNNKDNTCRYYTYDIVSMKVRSGAWSITKKDRCMATTKFNKQRFKSHTRRELTNCDAMAFNARGDIACLVNQNGVATVKTTVKHNPNKMSYTWKKFHQNSDHQSPGFKLLGIDRPHVQAYKTFYRDGLFSSSYWWYENIE